MPATTPTARRAPALAPRCPAHEPGPLGARPGEDHPRGVRSFVDRRRAAWLLLAALLMLAAGAAAVAAVAEPDRAESVSAPRPPASALSDRPVVHWIATQPDRHTSASGHPTLPRAVATPVDHQHDIADRAAESVPYRRARATAPGSVPSHWRHVHPYIERAK